MAATSHTKGDENSSKDIGNVDYQLAHARIRIYPREPSDVVRLTPSVVADTYGAWTEIVPAGMVSFPWHMVGVLVENQQGADTYMIQFSKNNPPANDGDILGELRIKLGALVGFFPTEGVGIKSADLPIAAGLYARLKTAAGTNWLDVAVQISRHFPQSYEPTPWPNWPW